jgi:hypothetical protein
MSFFSNLLHICYPKSKNEKHVVFDYYLNNGLPTVTIKLFDDGDDIGSGGEIEFFAEDRPINTIIYDDISSVDEYDSVYSDFDDPNGGPN